VFSGTMLVVGGIIGGGIFLSPAVVAQRVGTPGLTLAAWGLGAVVAIIGGFVYAELGARRPRSGGSYVYLRDAWGSLPAFLYGWALFLIMATGAIAAVAMTGAGYLVALLGWDASQARPVAAALITGLTALNVAGVRLGAAVGNLLTVLKLAAIAALVVAAFLVTPGAPATVAPRSRSRRARWPRPWRWGARWCRCSLPAAAGSRPTPWPRSCGMRRARCRRRWWGGCSSWRSRTCW
jgi:APA family basic amino acid/polyamine antiporter